MRQETGRWLTKREDRIFCSDIKEERTAATAAHSDEDKLLGPNKMMLPVIFIIFFKYKKFSC